MKPISLTKDFDLILEANREETKLILEGKGPSDGFLWQKGNYWLWLIQGKFILITPEKEVQDSCRAPSQN